MEREDFRLLNAALSDLGDRFQNARDFGLRERGLRQEDALSKRRLALEGQQIADRRKGQEFERIFTSYKIMREMDPMLKWGDFYNKLDANSKAIVDQYGGGVGQSAALPDTVGGDHGILWGMGKSLSTGEGRMNAASMLGQAAFPPMAPAFDFLKLGRDKLLGE